MWPNLIPGDNDLYKHESTPFEVASTQVSAFLAKWFMRRRFMKNINKFLINPYYVPLKGLHFNKLEFLSPKDALCQVWLKLVQWFWRKSRKCKKFTVGWTDRQTSRQTDGHQTKGDQKSSLELSAGYSYVYNQVPFLKGWFVPNLVEIG